MTIKNPPHLEKGFIHHTVGIVSGQLLIFLRAYPFHSAQKALLITQAFYVFHFRFL
ncbi:hypothetical protein BAMY6639_17475 [Bacillus amyloliquefaciens UMAF6639]|nr:hypothetical protein BAMY6639_17475 [Bacillus amyloliquefaciens UMAF6639]